MRDRDNITRKDEFGKLCQNILKILEYQHFTVDIVVNLFKKEKEKIEKLYPQLEVEVRDGTTISDSTVSSCAIHKKKYV